LSGAITRIGSCAPSGPGMNRVSPRAEKGGLGIRPAPRIASTPTSASRGPGLAGHRRVERQRFRANSFGANQAGSMTSAVMRPP
jgi:hypothetical protein